MRITNPESEPELEEPIGGMREHRRRRFRRRGRRAYIRSIYSLPTLATLGNAISGFASIYLASIISITLFAQMQAVPLSSLPMFKDPRLVPLVETFHFALPAYLIFLAMFFDAIDGRLARFARHTTDFGGQLDSLADIVSFGVAPAFLVLQVVKVETAGFDNFPLTISRLIWCTGALYLSCAAMRLARFNVSNEHGEQYHFSFLGLPSPGAAGAVASLVLVQQELRTYDQSTVLRHAGDVCVVLLPLVLLATGLLMVSHLRYPHIVNRYLTGRKSIARLLIILVALLLLVTALQYTIALICLTYAFWGPAYWAYLRLMRRAYPKSGVEPGAES